MRSSISVETSRSTMSRLAGLVMSSCAASVRRDGEPGPEPTRVMRPPV